MIFARFVIMARAPSRQTARTICLPAVFFLCVFLAMCKKSWIMPVLLTHQSNHKQIVSFMFYFIKFFLVFYTLCICKVTFSYRYIFSRQTAKLILQNLSCKDTRTLVVKLPYSI